MRAEHPEGARDAPLMHEIIARYGAALGQTITIILAVVSTLGGGIFWAYTALEGHYQEFGRSVAKVEAAQQISDQRLAFDERRIDALSSTVQDSTRHTEDIVERIERDISDVRDRLARQEGRDVGKR